MHAYFSQLKAQCACFLSTIHLMGKVYELALMKKNLVALVLIKITENASINIFCTFCGNLSCSNS